MYFESHSQQVDSQLKSRLDYLNLSHFAFLKLFICINHIQLTFLGTHLFKLLSLNSRSHNSRLIFSLLLHVNTHILQLIFSFAIFFLLLYRIYYEYHLYFDFGFLKTLAYKLNTLTKIHITQLFSWFAPLKTTICFYFTIVIFNAFLIWDEMILKTWKSISYSMNSFTH